MTAFIQNIDWAILHTIRDSLCCGALDFIMPKITLLGNGGALWIFIGALLLLTKKYRRYGVLLLATLAVGALIGTLGIKHLVARTRPCGLEAVELLIKHPGGYSFPSGHTQAAVTGAVILTAANRKFGWFAIPIAALIAFSRLYLYVHFPSDVLCAALLALILSFAALFIFGRLTAPKEAAA